MKINGIGIGAVRRATCGKGLRSTLAAGTELIQALRETVALGCFGNAPALQQTRNPSPATLDVSRSDQSAVQPPPPHRHRWIEFESVDRPEPRRTRAERKKDHSPRMRIRDD